MRDLDLAERGSEESTSKPGTFLQHAVLTKLESVFEAQLRTANSMESFLTAIANRLKTEELPAESKSIFNRYLLALSRAGDLCPSVGNLKGLHCVEEERGHLE